MSPRSRPGTPPMPSGRSKKDSHRSCCFVDWNSSSAGNAPSRLLSTTARVRGRADSSIRSSRREEALFHWFSSKSSSLRRLLQFRSFLNPPCVRGPRQLLFQTFLQSDARHLSFDWNDLSTPALFRILGAHAPSARLRGRSHSRLG